MNSYYLILLVFMIFCLIKNYFFYSPIKLQDIKRKIAAGELTTIGELQENLLILSYNAKLIHNNYIMCRNVSSFQSDVREYCRVLDFFP